MTQTITLQRALYAVYFLAAIAVLLYTIGAPYEIGG